MAEAPDLADQVDEDVCLICLEVVLDSSAVWQCSCCYELFHLNCCLAWVTRGVKKKTPLSQDLFPQAHTGWSCPKCRNVEMNGLSSTPTCFCGKETLAVGALRDKWLDAHCCDNVCERKLDSCHHRCTQPCHRGPCPSCPQMVDVHCNCGSRTLMSRCGTPPFSCGKLCEATLECGHTCDHMCHSECPPCTRSQEVTCHCGAVTRERACSEGPSLRCENICGRAFSCGIHTCQQVCHEHPEDSACPRSGPRSCSCGAVTREDLSCAEEVPTCASSCNRALPCGHACSSRCHTGDCPPCSVSVDKSCACGKMTRSLPCSAHQPVCNSRCPKYRSCTRHKCKRKCCSGPCRVCDEVCGAKLSCSNHKCAQFCHPGACLPCNVRLPIRCACGETVYRLPCGNERGARPPKCRLPCSFQVCHHQPTHACHFGQCKPCEKRCQLPMDCGHLCPSVCHDPLFALPPEPDVYVNGEIFLTKKQKQALKATGKPRRLTAEEAGAYCPPCPIEVARECIGGHRSFTVKCFENPRFDCGAPCARPLECSRHTCALQCHDSSVQCAPCTLPCGRRFSVCSHECPNKCHPGSCGRCERLLKRRCFCGGLEVRFQCWELQNEALVEARRHCGGQCPRNYPGCSHRCKRQCHEGPCEEGVCPKSVTVSCSCRRIKGKMTCLEAQAARREKEYAVDSTLLLVCDATCEEIKAERKLRQRPPSSPRWRPAAKKKPKKKKESAAGKPTPLVAKNNNFQIIVWAAVLSVALFLTILTLDG